MAALVLSYADVRAALSPSDCADAMAAVLAAHARGEAYMPLRTVVFPPGAPGFMGLMPAYAAGGPFALKALCLMPGNPARGLDMHQGTVTLFDGDTGAPTAVINASALTEVRTAAVTAVATRLLAREDARVLAIVGAGVQGRAHLEALAGVRDFAEVRIYAPTEAHARELAAAQPPGGPAYVVADRARAAVDGADVVVAATNSRTPVLEHWWLARGAHVNAIGASTPSARELEVTTVATGTLFCDSRVSLRNEAGEYLLALEQGAIAEDHMPAELGEVLAGLLPGRRDPGELTVFRSLGIGIEDLAAGVLAVSTARRLGLGAEVQL